MAMAGKALRRKMLVTTAVAAVAMAPGVANAQLVSAGDLDSVVDQNGETGAGTHQPLVISAPNASTRNFTVNSNVVIANWTQFNVPALTTLNVTPGIDAGAVALTQATLINRVTGGDFSDIGGTINANNINFWLINQNGILFGDNTVVNANSFFASTANVSNADLFDFYTGTNVFGNGTSQLRFTTASNSTITTSAPGADFNVNGTPSVSLVGDGTLAFVSRGLNLNASFDSTNGKIAFVTADQVDIQFSAGSPLVFTLPTGTGIAQQTIGGTVNGQTVEFRMYTANNFVSDMLINANVTANAAVASGNGIRLFTEKTTGGGPTDPDIGVTGSLTSNDGISFNTEGDQVNITAGVINADADANGTGNLAINRVGGGNIGLSATSINAAGITTTGAVDIEATGNITATSVTSTSTIDIDSTAGGNLSVGNLVAAGNITLDTTGNISMGSLTNPAIDLAIGSSFQPVNVTLNGNVSVDEFSVSLTGAFAAQNLTTDNSDIAINAASISTGILTALNDAIDLDSAGSITTGAINANTTIDLTAVGAITTGGGNITSNSGNITLDGLTILTGAISTNNADISLTADLVAPTNATPVITTGNISITTAGNIDVEATNGGRVFTGNLSTLDDVSLTTSGQLQTGTINTANLTISEPSSLVTGLITAGSVDIDTTGALDVSATLSTAINGITLEGLTVTAGNLSASAGNISLTANGNGVTPGTVTAGNLTASQILVASGNNGGFTLGNVLANNGITFNTTGAISALVVNADNDAAGGGALVGTTALNLTATSVNASAITSNNGAINISTSGAVTSGNVTSTNGGTTIASTGGGAVNLGNISSGGIVDLDTTGAVLAGGVTATGALTVGVSGNLPQSPSSVQFTGNISAASVGIFTPGIFRAESLGGTDRNITATNGGITIDALNIVAEDLTAANGAINITARQTGLAANTTVIDLGILDTNATGDINIKSLGDTLAGNAGGGRILTGDIDARGPNNNSAVGADNVNLDTSGNIQTGKIFANTLTVGGMIIPENFVRANGSKVVNEIINSTGIVNLGDSDVASSLVLTAGQIIGGNVTAGGQINLTATGSLSLAGTITATSFTASGPVTLTSNDNSAITVSGFITADDGNNATTENVTFVTNGAITFGDITATGALNLGTPSALTITGDIDVGSFNFTTGLNFVANDVLTDSGLSITANLIEANAVEASNGNVTLVATAAVNPGTPALTLLPGGIRTDSITAGGNITATGQNGVLLNLGNLVADGTISLNTTGAVTTGSIDADDDGNGTGDLLIGTAIQPVASVTLTGNASAANVNIQTVGALSAATRNIVATGGSVDIDAASITAAAINSVGGGIVLDAGPITTTSMNSDTTIDVNGTGLLTLGNLVADDGITLDTTGTHISGGAVIVGSINADDDANGTGALSVGQTAQPTSVTFNGAASASNIVIDTSGTFNAQALTTTGTGGTGTINVQAGGLITTGNISSTAQVLMQSVGTLTTGTINVTGTDQFIALRASGAGSDVSTGNNTTNGGFIYLTAADAISTGDLTIAASSSAIAGFAILHAGGSLLTGAIDVDSDLLASAGGTFTADSVLAGDDITVLAGGAVAISGDVITDGTGPKLNAISLGATVPGNFGAALVAEDPGSNISITSDSTISIQNLSAVDGNISLISRIAGAPNSTNVITTDNITITGSGNLLAENRLPSTVLGTGRIQLGQLAVVGGATLSTLGELETDQINAQSLTIATPSSVTFNGSVTAPALSIATSGGIDLGAGDLISDAVSLNADFVNAANIIANNGSVTITVNGDGVNPASGTVTTDSITATNGLIDITSLDGGALNLGALDADTGIALDTAGTVAATTVDAGTGALAIGSTAALTPSSVTFTGAVTAGSIDINTSGAFTAAGQNVTATSGTLDIDAASITAAIVSAAGTANLVSDGAVTTASISSTNGNVTVLSTGAGTLDLGPVSATNGLIDIQSDGGGALDLGDLAAGNGIALDTSGTVDAGIVSGGNGALVVGSTAALTPSSVTFTGASSGSSVTINSSGVFDATGQTVTATNGSVVIDASAIDAGLVSASQNATLTADGGILTTGITATAGLIDVASTAGGALNLGNLQAGNGIEIDTSSTVASGSAAAGTGPLRVGTDTDRVASATFTGALSGQSISIFANGALDASGQTLTANGGAIELFADTVTAGDTNASGDLILETAGDATFAGIGAANVDAQVGGTLSVSGDVDVSGAALIQAADVEFDANLSVLGSELVFRPLAGLTVGLGVADGDFTLSTEEISRISAERLVIDAVDQNVGIDTVTFGANAGASEVIIATTGEIAITGDLIGEGDGRTFRLGGDFDGTDGVLASRITADIDTSEVNIADSLLDLRGSNIVFGRTNLIDAVAPLTNEQIADQFVGNSTSDLYNPLFAGALSEKLTAQPVYLRAGNLTVTYENSALFQNSSIAAGQFTGVQLGEVGADGVMTVNPIDDTNTFAFFGQINLLTGQTVALAGGAVIVINDNTDISASRVNGCIISSGADCRTTIVGTTIIEVPREATSVLIADDGLLIPFDPLVGTNNEGLFADAAADPQPDCIPGEGVECPEN